MLYFIKAVDNDMVLINYYGSYKFITYEEFKKSGGNVMFVTETKLREIFEIHEDIDGYNLQGLSIRIFSDEIGIVDEIV